jgi:hypothetical protein
VGSRRFPQPEPSYEPASSGRSAATSTTPSAATSLGYERALHEGHSGEVAVKVIDDRGDELLVVRKLSEAQ